MDKVTISKEEYKKLLETKKRFETLYFDAPRNAKKSGFYDKAFGILRDSFGKKTSGTYVSALRKAWRK